MRTPCMTGSPTGRALRALVTGVATVALALTVASTASAHDEVVATSPAAGTSLAAAPPVVELQVTSPPQALGTEVRVSGPDGSVVSTGEPEVLDSTVRQPLADGLPAGAYTVDWRVTSGDGHAITGSFGFTVAASAPSAAASVPVAPSDEPSTEVDMGEASASAPASSTSPSTALLVGGAVVVLLVGGLVSWRLRRRA